MTPEETALLTRTGPGTPCGELMRRYWQPAALAEELPVGGAPLPVRLLGEDLVLFRDDRGRLGLLGLHCSHRGADLSYGRVEDGGLRCIYHGWLYDIEGRCMEQPGEPGGGPNRDAIRHPAYACREKAGIIFAYMGAGEPPLFPGYDGVAAPDEQVFPTKLFSDCNYLQGNEGNIDLIHNNFLHYMKRDLSALSPEQARLAVERFGSPESFSGRGPAPGMESTDCELLDYGLRIFKIRKAGDGKHYVRVATFVLPSLTVIPGGTINWHVPIDDARHWKYIIQFNRQGPIDKEKAKAYRDGMAPPPQYRPLAKQGARYLQVREAMKTFSYSGVTPRFIPVQDLCAIEGAGVVQDRSREHLPATDVPIVVARKVLMKAIRDLQEGREPANVIRDSKRNEFPDIVATFGLIPAGMHWKDYAKQLVAEGKGWQTLQP